jgi:hypothetical protein
LADRANPGRPDECSAKRKAIDDFDSARPAAGVKAEAKRSSATGRRSGSHGIGLAIVLPGSGA